MEGTDLSRFPDLSTDKIACVKSTKAHDLLEYAIECSSDFVLEEAVSIILHYGAPTASDKDRYIDLTCRTRNSKGPAQLLMDARTNPSVVLDKKLLEKYLKTAVK
jgi:hypothetical protein